MPQEIVTSTDISVASAIISSKDRSLIPIMVTPKTAPISKGKQHMPRDAGQQIAVAVVLMSLSLWMLPTSALAIDVGDKAPDFVMHSTVGETVRLSEYQGQMTVLMFFFPAAFTSV
jgi:hypothetical protein